jgi:DNA-binding protein H-NS
MSSELESKTEQELQEIINRATAALKAKADLKQKEVISKIKELADSINMKVEIFSLGDQKPATKTKLKNKYMDDKNPLNTWTGRGLPPQWLKGYMAEGRDKDEFLIKE